MLNMAHLSISCLGTFVVTLGEKELTAFRSVKNRALLAYLAVEMDRSHERDGLSGLFWPDHPEDGARLNLRQALFRLRQLLKHRGRSPFLLVDRRTARFNPESDYRLDVAAFAQLIEACAGHAHADRADCPSCAARLAEAVDLYRGDFMSGIFLNDSAEIEGWMLLKREWFRHQALDALADLAVFHDRRQRYTAAYRYAWRQVELDPLREEAYRQGMRALALNGQHSEALGLYENCRQILSRELGVDPAVETATLADSIRNRELTGRSVPADSSPSSRSVAAPTPIHNLPSAGTVLIGRESEVARLRELLLNPETRLISLVGTGGVGKTRLALAAAASVVPRFADGVRFVPLVGVGSPGADPDALCREIVAAIADALGLTFGTGAEPKAQLLDALHPREILLVLDNFEHLLAAAVLIQELLQAAPRLVVLVTSRERLNFQTEQAWRVEGLPVPAPGDPDVRSYSSVKLFAERAARSPAGFRLDESSLPHVISICQLVQGLPLGIELAATWVEQFTVAEIAETIGENIDFLAANLHDLPQRHRSLRAVFDYSWRLLTRQEQRVLAQCAIFRETFDRDAVLAVTDASLADLVSLVNKSLLQVVAPGRYALHELVRQFAAEQLAQRSEEAAAVAERHADYYLAFVAKRADALRGSAPQQAAQPIRQALGDVRQAWQWAVIQGRSAALAKSVVGLGRFFILAGLFGEGEALLAHAVGQMRRGRTQVTAAAERVQAAQAPAALLVVYAEILAALARFDDVVAAAREAIGLAPPEAVAAVAYLQLGAALWRLGEAGTARQAYEQALVLARTAQNLRIEADVLLALGDVPTYQGDQRGIDLYAEALRCYRDLGDRYGEAGALQNLGQAFFMRRDYEAAQTHIEACLRVRRELGDRHGEGQTLATLGNIFAMQGDYARSNAYLEQAVAMARRLGTPMTEVTALYNLGMNCSDQHDDAAAKRYYEQALPISRRIGYQRAEGNILNNLGNLALFAGDFADAERHYQAALAMARTTGDRYCECTRLLNLGDALRNQGRYVLARDWYEQALSVAEAIGDRRVEARTRVELGMLCALFGEPVKALFHYRTAIDMARDPRDKWCLGRGLAALSRLYQEIGEPDRARQAGEEALALAQQNPGHPLQVYVFSQLGTVAIAQHDYSTAQETFRHLLALEQVQREPHWALEARVGQAAIYLAQDQLLDAQLRIEEVLPQLQQCRLGDAWQPFRCYWICYEVMRSAGDPRASDVRAQVDQLVQAQAAALDVAARARFLAQVTIQRE